MRLLSEVEVNVLVDHWQRKKNTTVIALIQGFSQIVFNL